MTYIVALHQPGIVALISDTRLTWNTPPRTGANTGLKIGRFFDGCIFGCTGNTSRSANFICDFKERIESEPGTPSSYWKKLERYVAGYEFPNTAEEQFQIVVSTRASGRPQLYVIDSVHRAIYQEPVPQELRDDHAFAFAYGSGRQVLDLVVTDNFAKRLADLQPQILKQEGARACQMIAPYLLCLWLSELTFGYHAAILAEGVGVGGPFHFICQTAEGEFPQLPALYLFGTGDPKSRHFYSWGYRVVHIPAGALYVERKFPQQFPSFLEPVSETILLMDRTTTDPELVGLSVKDNERFQASVKDQVDALPFYVFCGFGNPDVNILRSRGFNAFLADNGVKEDIFTNSGELWPEIQQMMLDQYLKNFDQ